jgi:hypothetical protein
VDVREGCACPLRCACARLTEGTDSYNSSSPQPSHYTQVVWKATTQLGCAWVDCAPGAIFPAKYGRTPFHVCEYYPQGNVIGYFGCVPLPYPEMREG